MAAAVRPGPGFRGVKLDISSVPAGDRFGRIYYGHHPDPLGYGKSSSRFSDPRRRVPKNRFGVLYLGRDLKVCFLEAILRDERNGAVGDWLMDEAELDDRRFAEVHTSDELQLIDLRGDGPVRMGIPTDVVGASSQSLRPSVVPRHLPASRWR